MPFLKALKLSRTDNPKSKSFRSAFIDTYERFGLSVALKNVSFHLQGRIQDFWEGGSCV